MTGGDGVEILSRETLYQGHFRLFKLTLRHRLFAGGLGPPISREVLDRAGAVAVLPYDPERDRVVLIEQFRIGPYLAGADPWLTEVVAGLIEPGETPPDVATRETAEETGCRVGDLVAGPRYFSSPGAFSEMVHTFIGRTSSDGAGGVHGLASEHEDIRVVVRDLAVALADLERGRILFGPAVVALQWLALNRDRVRRRWLG